MAIYYMNYVVIIITALQLWTKKMKIWKILHAGWVGVDTLELWWWWSSSSLSQRCVTVVNKKKRNSKETKCSLAGLTSIHWISRAGSAGGYRCCCCRHGGTVLQLSTETKKETKKKLAGLASIHWIGGAGGAGGHWCWPPSLLELGVVVTVTIASGWDGGSLRLGLSSLGLGDRRHWAR